jgi:ATP-dependent helicase HrpB
MSFSFGPKTPRKFYPIDPVLPALRKAAASEPALVLKAPPGSGKTTRAPFALLPLLPPEKGRIVVLEPRRLAAVSAARWMAQAVGESVGETVGYSIRFDSRTSPKTRIEFATEGVFTRRIQVDPALEGVALVVFDEFHERSLQTDLALALCLDVRRSLREDLKILVMSATLDCGPVASLLGGCPVVSSSGEAFPVEERYLPGDRGKPIADRAAAAARKALSETSGDILVFLPGAGEIRACAEILKNEAYRTAGEIGIHPLYADLPFEDQERALLPGGRRRVVLATNIAETSLTIEGVRVVIDCGFTRRLQYDPASGMNRLVTVPVSKSAAEQRKGRAGRLEPGVCYRLYDRHAFQSLIPFAPPEMLVADLAPLALELALWGVKDPATLSWLDPPPAPAWESAKRLLVDLGALDPGGAITTAGRRMSRFPLHPRLGRLLERAVEAGFPRLGADLAALLSERDIFRSSPSDPPGRERDLSVGSRLDALRRWRQEKKAPPGADPIALGAADRVSRQIARLLPVSPALAGKEPADLIPRLLLRAFPDRVAGRREKGGDRFVLSGGRGVKAASPSGLAGGAFIVAARVDAGEKAEGVVHLAEPVTEGLIREELPDRLEPVRRVEWDRREERIVAVLEERIGALRLSARPASPGDEEVASLLCAQIRSGWAGLIFGREARQFQARVDLMRKVFPNEGWPDLSAQNLLAAPERWLQPFLRGIRTRAQLAALDLLPPLRALLPFEKQRRLDERAPLSLLVPSGHRVPLDYTSGDEPVLAVKLQEMFGLADTPAIAAGRVKVLIHLLSPARRPVQITRDLRGFWNSGYREVKKELKARYPKHPWPDDPWNAVPTRKTTPRSR